MGYREEIPMEEPYRQQLKKEYEIPLRKNTILIWIFAICISTLILWVIFNRAGKINYYLFLILIPVLITCRLLYKKLAQHKLYYYKDYEFGHIVKERTTVIKVFDTPAGITIYWLDCDAIKTFTPDPYRLFREGDRVTIYYLKYSKEYLAYEV